MNQFAAFLVAGGLAALANILSRILLDTAVTYEVAILLAYLVGVTVAFLLNKRFVFKAAPGASAGQYGRFLLVNVVAFLQVWLVSVLLARFLFPALGFHNHGETIAHVIGVLSPVVTSFLLHKHFSFRAG
jgi:putative flippase GtrA